MQTFLSPKNNLNFDGQATPVKTALFLVVCLAWLVPGLTGHTPWKYDEAVSQGIVFGLTHGEHWLAPTLAGEPYLNHPPLYYWIAALMVKLFNGVLPEHDAARLASGLFMAFTMLGVAVGARSLYGPRAMRASVLMFIGSVGLVIRAHEMSANLAWLTGVTWTLTSIPLSRHKPLLAGITGGLGFGVAFLTHGVWAFGILLPLVLLLPLAIPDYRPARPGPHALLWLLAASPELWFWLWDLHRHDPASFKLWWTALVHPLTHPALWMSSNANPLYYFGVISWFAWPATPLAVATLWNGGRRGLATPQTRFCLLSLLIMLMALGVGSTPRENNALPLLLPLTFLATGGLDQLKRGAASALDWFGMLTFGIVAATLWLGWMAQMTGYPAGIVHYLDAQLPGYRATFQPVIFSGSLFLTVLWLLAMKHTRSSARRALVNWTVGMTVSWMLLMGLWLPYVEASRSYAGMMYSLSRHIPHSSGCVMGTGLGEPQRGLLYYYLRLRTEPANATHEAHCRLWLVQTTAQAHDPVPPGWHMLWTGARPGDRSERFLLLER